MFKVLINDIIVLERVLEIPEHCPGQLEGRGVCGADLTEHNALHVMLYQDRQHKAHVDPGGVFDALEWYGPPQDGGGIELEVEYRCAKCDYEFGIGEFESRIRNPAAWKLLLEALGDDK